SPAALAKRPVICHLKSKSLEEPNMKKCNLVKKLFALTAACALGLSLAACSNSAGQQSQSGASDTPASAGAESSQGTGETYTVAIIKQMDHPSLDEIAKAIEARLTEIAGENG